MLNFTFVWMLSNVAVNCIDVLKGDRDVLHGMHSSLNTFCLTVRNFWLSLYLYQCFVLTMYFYGRLWLVLLWIHFRMYYWYFNICQCLLIISLIFGKVGLYVTENGITFFNTVLVLFNRIDLSILSTFSISFRMMFSLYLFSTNCLTKSFECFLYSSKVYKYI